ASLLVAWIPCIGLLSILLSGISLCLALIGLLWACLDGREFWSPIAGACTSTVALAMSFICCGLLGQMNWLSIGGTTKKGESQVWQNPENPRPIAAEKPVKNIPLPGQIDFANSIGMKFKLIKSGTFLMGSPEGE